MYTFEYHGGIAHDGSKAGKFLLFLIIGDKEVPFFQATKTGLVRPASIAPDASPMSVRNQCTYECESPIVKLFMKEDRKNAFSFMYTFFFMLGSGVAMNTFTLRPHDEAYRKSDYYLKLRGRSMTKREVHDILGPDSLSVRMLINQSTLSKYTLRRVVSMDKPVVNQVTGVRKIRI